MPRSLIDTYCLSMEPHLAMATVLGDCSMLFIPGGIDGYTGRLFIHATRYQDTDTAKEGYRYLIEEGFNDPEAFAPQCSILGYVKITSNEPYIDSSLFEANIDKHLIPGSYQDMLNSNGWSELMDIHCLILEDQHYLKDPIISIKDYPGEGLEPGTFWLPSSPIEMEAMKMATQKDRVLTIADFEE